MINKILGWGGLFLVGLGFYLMIDANDKDNPTYWYDHGYTLISRHVSGHEYKGNWYADYYFTVSYDGDKQYNWTFEVTGSEYFSQTEGKHYSKRDTKPAFDSVGNWVIWLLIIGAVGLSFGIASSMEY